MTAAPAALLADRALLLEHLDMNPGRAVSSDLDPAEVGIVGDTSHVLEGDSYHLGLPQQQRVGYAATESPRDGTGLTNAACALDIGEFRVVVRGKTHDLRSFSAWVVAQCKADTPDSKDIREVIYSLDGKTVRRWDRLGRRTTGDSSHTFHTHLSVFRDAIKAGRGLKPLLTRYLTEIGLLAAATAAATPEDTTMYRIKAKDNSARYLLNGAHIPSTPVDQILAAKGIDLIEVDTTADLMALLPPTGAQLVSLQAQVTLLAGKDFTDEGAIVRGVLQGLDPDAIVTAIVAALPTDQAKQIVDLLTARLKQVVDLLDA